MFFIKRLGLIIPTLLLSCLIPSSFFGLQGVAPGSDHRLLMLTPQLLAINCQIQYVGMKKSILLTFMGVFLEQAFWRANQWRPHSVHHCEPVTFPFLSGCCFHLLLGKYLHNCLYQVYSLAKSLFDTLIRDGKIFPGSFEV